MLIGIELQQSAIVLVYLRYFGDDFQEYLSKVQATSTHTMHLIFSLAFIMITKCESKIDDKKDVDMSDFLEYVDLNFEESIRNALLQHVVDTVRGKKKPQK